LKKFLTIILFSTLLFACDNKNAKKVTLDGVEFTYKYENGTFARIVTSEMVNDTSLLRRAIEDLNLKEERIYFHIPGLTNTGEQYATLNNNYISLSNNAPRTQKEADHQKMLDEMKYHFTELEKIEYNYDLQYSEIPTYLNVFKKSADSFKAYKDSPKPVVRDMATDLRARLISTQQTVLPKLRTLYFEKLKKNLEEENIRVESNGQKISFIGPLYADKNKIKESYDQISKMLYDLRFTRVNYKAKDNDVVTYFTTNAPEDNEIE